MIFNCGFFKVVESLMSPAEEGRSQLMARSVSEDSEMETQSWERVGNE